MKGTGSAKQGYRRGGFWRYPKCSGQMEIKRIKTHLVWVDELDRIPDSNNQLRPTIAYVGKD